MRRAENRVKDSQVMSKCKEREEIVKKAIQIEKDRIPQSRVKPNCKALE